MNNDTTLLLSQYIDWLKNNYRIKNLDKSSQITTPFTNAIGDNINIYVDKIGDKNFLLSDDGETINDLSLNGIELTATRNQMIDRILIGSGVKRVDDELNIQGIYTEFPEKKHSLLQAILRVNDLMMTKRNSVVNLFSDEVTAFLKENDIIGTSKAKFSGISGLNYTIDYTIPARKNRPEIFLQFHNHLTFSAITNSTFIFEDINEQRPLEVGDKPINKIIANTDDYDVSDKAFRVAESKNIEILPFSDKQKVLAALS